MSLGMSLTQQRLLCSIVIKSVKVSEVAQSRLTLCDPMDCSPAGSSVHGIFQTRMLEWVAISFSRGSSQPRERTQVSRIAGRGFNLWATTESQLKLTSEQISPIEMLMVGLKEREGKNPWDSMFHTNAMRYKVGKD